MDQFCLCSNSGCQNRDFLRGDRCPSCGANTGFYSNADANQLLAAKRAPQLQMQNNQALYSAPAPPPVGVQWQGSNMGQFRLCSNSGCQNRDFLRGDRCPSCGANTALYNNADANQLFAIKRNVQTQQGSPFGTGEFFRLCSNPECPNRAFLRTDTCPSCKAKTGYYDNAKANQLLAAKRAPQLKVQILSWKDAIILQQNEKWIFAWTGDHEVERTVVMQGNSTIVKVAKRGVLVLTNQKLIFLEAHGVFEKSYHEEFAIQLPAIQGISLGGRYKPFISISNENQAFVFHIEGVGKNEFNSFRSLIMEQFEKRMAEIEAEKRRNRVQVVLDFSVLREYMEKGGLVLQKTRCPECGASLVLPSEGNQTRCEHCGNLIYAQDIFEKVKSLIG